MSIVKVEQPFGAVWQPRNFRSLGRGQDHPKIGYKGLFQIQSGPVPKGPYKLVTGVGTTPLNGSSYNATCNLVEARVAGKSQLPTIDIQVLIFLVG